MLAPDRVAVPVPVLATALEPLKLVIAPVTFRLAPLVESKVRTESAKAIGPLKVAPAP